jgi:hypothetical protein
MGRCRLTDIERHLDSGTGAVEPAPYRRRGPLPATRLRADAIRSAQNGAETLLDVGGGIGAVHHAPARRVKQHSAQGSSRPRETA